MLAVGIANYVDCSFGVKSYYVYDWCFVTDSQMCGLFVAVHGVVGPMYIHILFRYFGDATT